MSASLAFLLCSFYVFVFHPTLHFQEHLLVLEYPLDHFSFYVIFLNQENLSLAVNCFKIVMSLRIIDILVTWTSLVASVINTFQPAFISKNCRSFFHTLFYSLNNKGINFQVCRVYSSPSVQNEYIVLMYLLSHVWIPHYLFGEFCMLGETYRIVYSLYYLPVYQMFQFH